MLPGLVGGLTVREFASRLDDLEALAKKRGAGEEVRRCGGGEEIRRSAHGRHGIHGRKRS